MIAQYDDPQLNKFLDAPRQYGITQNHKHLPEISKICGLDYAPVFCPIVAPYFAGMEVTITIHAQDINANIDELKKFYAEYYSCGIIKLSGGDDFNEGGFLSAGAFSGRDDLEISIHGNDERILLVSRFDNLGKGASGAAIQNMNILLGIDGATGLNV